SRSHRAGSRQTAVAVPADQLHTVTWFSSRIAASGGCAERVRRVSRRAVEGGTELAVGLDGTLLVQEQLPAGGAAIVRIELPDEIVEDAKRIVAARDGGRERDRNADEGRWRRATLRRRVIVSGTSIEGGGDGGC